jgi:hypothetical protein
MILRWDDYKVKAVNGLQEMITMGNQLLLFCVEINSDVFI